MNLIIKNTLPLFVLIAMQSFTTIANADGDRVSPGFCGSMGCDTSPTRVQIMTAVINHPDFEPSLELEVGSKIESVDITFKSIPDDFVVGPKAEEVNIRLTHITGPYDGMSYRCAKVKYTQSKASVNGNKPVKIGERLALISFEGGSCQ